MMRSLVIAAIALVGCVSTVNALQPSTGGSRRAFISQTVSTSAAVIAVSTFGANNAQAAPEKAAPEILNTPGGVKYAVLKKPKDGAALPQKGDIVAIEYTGRYISAN
jgi:FKBP-type peptidyl-prolyl cis-trans isomerase